MATRKALGLVAAGMVAAGVGLGLGWMLGEVKERGEVEDPGVSETEVAEVGKRQEVEPALWLGAWLPYWDKDRVQESLEMGGKQLATISPVWYRLTENGMIEPYDEGLIKEMMRGELVGKLAVMPTVGNDLDGKRADGFLSGEADWEAAIEVLLNEAEKYGFKGYDFDWEGVGEVNAVAYVDFLERVKPAFNEKGLALSVTVHARTGSTVDWEGALGHDYAGLSEVADEVRVMAYDYHSATSLPGAVTPLSWYEQVIEYAQSRVPAEKLVIGLPLYGYDWPVDGTGMALMYEDVMGLSGSYDLEMERDELDGVLRVNYQGREEEHEVWFEDAMSVERKLKLAREKGVNRFFFWRLGGEDPKLWEVVGSLEGAGED